MIKGANMLPGRATSVAKVIGYTLGGAVCSALVAAISYEIGNLISGRLGGRFLAIINTSVAISDRIGWGSVGAIVGTVIGASVGAVRRRSVSRGFLGGILGAIVFVVDNPRTTEPVMDGLINWVTIAGIAGLISCGIAAFIKGVNKNQHGSEDVA